MYRSGANQERQLLNRLKKAGYFGVRAAKSACPDLLVGKGGRAWAIECKYVKGDALYVPAGEIRFLNEFASAFGCEGILAVKFGRADWVFLKAGEIKANGSGHCAIKKGDIPQQTSIEGFE